MPTTILLEGGTSRYIGSLQLYGGPAYIVTLGSTSTTPATISQSIPLYVGANSIDAGNNTDVYFLASASLTDYVSVSYITGHVTTTVPATCAEVATATDGVNAQARFNASTADLLTASDAPASNYLWNLIDDTQTPNWVIIDT
jgi:hypothetical protein